MSAMDASSLGRSHARHFVDDGDHVRVVEVDNPCWRIEPRFLDALRLDLVPLRAGQGGHLHGVDRLLTWLFQQYPHLVRRAARGDLPPEAKFRIPRGLLELRMIAKVLEHALLDLRLPTALLPERRRAAVDRLGLGEVELFRSRALRRQLRAVELRRVAAGHQHSHGHEQPEETGPHMRADSSTMPRSTTRAALPRSCAKPGGTSGDSASCR